MICVGGSVAGAAAAAFFARAGLRVLVMDRAAFPRHKACGEGVLPHGVDVLRRLGVSVQGGAPTRGVRFTVGGRSSVFEFPGVVGASGTSGAARGPTAAGSVVAVESPSSPDGGASPQAGSFGTREEGPPPDFPPSGYGLAVSRYVLDSAIRARARELGASFVEAKVSRVFPPASTASGAPGRVVTDRGEFAGRVLMGADGVHSIFHRDLGVRTREVGSRVGLSAHVSGFEAARDLVEVTAFPGGEVYVAPLSSPDAEGDAGLTLVAFLVDRRLGMGAGDVVGFLRRLFPARAERARLEREVLGSAPLWRRVDRVAGPGWLLVGDAAGSIDPISGEGLSAALVGAEIAGEVVPRVLAGEGSLSEYAARLLRFKRPVERLTRVLLLLSERPRAARVVLRREMGPSSMMRVATGAMGFWPGLLRAAVELV